MPTIFSGAQRRALPASGLHERGWCLEWAPRLRCGTRGRVKSTTQRFFFGCHPRDGSVAHPMRSSSAKRGSASRVKREKTRGLSSAGRASALQAEGRRFDPDRLHQDHRAEGADLGVRLSCSAVRGRAGNEPSVLIDEGSTFLVLAGIRPAVSMAPATASLTS